MKLGNARLVLHADVRALGRPVLRAYPRTSHGTGVASFTLRRTIDEGRLDAGADAGRRSPFDRGARGLRHRRAISASSSIASRKAAHGQLIHARLDALGLGELGNRARAAEAELYNQGITFTIYSDGDAIDRILPFDVIPRIITAADWAVIEAGVRQRVQTLNLFLADIYGPQKVLKDGIIPSELVLGNANYRAEMQRPEAAARHLHPHQRHRSRARRRRAGSACSRTMAARRPACPTWSRTGI